jgi:hypothetical protein
MENTTSGTIETHQEVYEWWRNKKQEFYENIDKVSKTGSVDQDILDQMKNLLGKARIRKVSLEEYLEKEGHNV